MGIIDAVFYRNIHTFDVNKHFVLMYRKVMTSDRNEKKGALI